MRYDPMTMFYRNCKIKLIAFMTIHGTIDSQFEVKDSDAKLQEKRYLVELI